MNIAYFAGGNRIDTLSAVFNSEKFNINLIYIASNEGYSDQYILFAKKNNIDLLILSKKELHDIAYDPTNELLLSVGFRYILPPSVFEKYVYAINIHPTLLPKYRGAYSGFEIIKNGDEKTGITAHFISSGVDTGDIFLQREVSLTKFDSVHSMSKKVLVQEPSFVIEALDLIYNNSFERVYQKDLFPAYNKKPKPEDFCLDWNLPLKDLYNIIRSSSNNMPSYFELDGKKNFYLCEDK